MKMTVCCEYCRNATGAKPRIPLCKSTCFTAAEEINQRIPYKPFRSTKGASKARRDHINAEIRNMRALLPISEDEKESLPYLHTMSVICSYIRKSLFCQDLRKDTEEPFPLPYEDFLQALPGFIVAVSSEGKLIYISENVTEYLGYSMVDLFQGEGFYDMIKSADLHIAKTHLQSNSLLETERSFVCRMHTSKSFRLRHGSSCAVLVRGRFQALPGTPPSPSSSGAVFVALCTPTVNWLQDSETHSYLQRFQSHHLPDMKFTDTPDSVLYHLGYSAEEMTGRSWYSLLHPDDLSFAASQHKLLLKGDEECHVEMVVRLQCKDLSWTWVYIRALLDSAKQSVTCINYIISETEATFLRQQIDCQSEHGAGVIYQKSVNEYQNNAPAPSTNQNHKEKPAKSRKRQLDNDILVKEPRNKASRISEPSIYTYYVSCVSCVNSSPAVPCYTPSTPPYSPQSDCSSFLQEDSRSLSFSNTNFLVDTYGAVEGLLPPAGNSPSYYSSELYAVPNQAVASEPLPAIEDSAFSLGSFSGSQVMTEELSPSASGPPSHDFSSCTNDVHLVPDCMTMEEVSGGVSDCCFHFESFSIPGNFQGNLNSYMPGQSSAEASVVPGSLLTPVSSPTAQNSFQYSEKERTEISILARQISCLASSFDAYQSIDQVLNIPGDFTNVQEPQGDQQQFCSWTDSVMLEPESVLNEGVFDSILKDLATVSAKETDPCSPSASCADPEQTPMSAVSYSMESNQLLLDTNTTEPAGLSIMPLEDDLPLDEFSTVHPAFDSFMMRSVCDGYSNELPQLNEYLHHSLQQDGSVEESMY
ncbi:neuronal PAS domain-containing protein 4-like [Polyodon spathula]|uniref:neuronal PAS domain-containing protein 4-like n=1 Tax=Polyodon spathula TaxID=7913 RepID=UPI001B7F75B6|nr:neuronal PAS domain-containing protein 4-like [Polyodon spathula]